MSFEQLETQDREQKKKKKIEGEQKEQFFIEQSIRKESSQLLQKLAGELAREFGIDISEAKNLIEGTTKDALQNLSSSGETLNSIQKQKLDQAILHAKDILKQSSKETRENLKKSLENEYIFGEKTSDLSQTLFGPELIQRGVSPKTLADQMLGGAIGLIDTTEAVILFVYGLGKGILITPYHIYLLVTGKAQYEAWKKV